MAFFCGLHTLHSGREVRLDGCVLLAIDSSDFNVVANPADPEPTTPVIGRAFLDPNQYLIPFELASVLLLAALVGAAYLARRRRNT